MHFSRHYLTPKSFGDSSKPFCEHSKMPPTFNTNKYIIIKDIILTVGMKEMNK